MSLKEIEAEIKKLSLKERGILAKRLIDSLEHLSESEIESLWAEEAERRLDDVERGRASEILAEEALRQARAAIA